MIVQRFEKGQKFLDLNKYASREMDDDGFVSDNESWEVVIYENSSSNYNDHKIIEFANEILARMFISQNDWKEQVL